MFSVNTGVTPSPPGSVRRSNPPEAYNASSPTPERSFS